MSSDPLLRLSMRTQHSTVMASRVSMMLGVMGMVTLLSGEFKMRFSGTDMSSAISWPVVAGAGSLRR